jgi:DNA-binding HxlR family transcriptional regulator
MSNARRYRLLCPIARALDRVGDRWALLILRDLHAGPARFSDLMNSLSGIASNLLANRLEQLACDGLVEKRDAGYGVTLYALTSLGMKSRELLFELARFGGEFEPDEDIRPTESLRASAVTLAVALQRAGPGDVTGCAALVIDEQELEIRVEDGQASVSLRNARTPDLRIETTYEATLDISSGILSIEDYLAHYARVDILREGQSADLLELIGSALEKIAAPF